MFIYDLPDDILLEVLLSLSVLDILSLKQTCRSFHALCSLEYIWHHSILPGLTIPLGIPSDVASSMSSEEIQQVVINAIKLEQSWRKPTSRIKAVTPILHDPENVSIDEMKLLPGAEWLVTAQRNRPRGRLSSSVSLWCLEDTADIRRTALVEIPGTYRDFSICLSKDEEWVTLAIGLQAIGNQEMLQVYEFPIDNNPEFLVHATPVLRRNVSRPAHIDGVVHEVSVHGDVVAVTFATVDAATGHSHQLLLVNFRTEAQQAVNQMVTEPFGHLSTRLTYGHIALLGDISDAFVMRVYEIPHYIFATEQADSARPLDEKNPDILNGLGLLVSECRLPKVRTWLGTEIAICDSVGIPNWSPCERLSLIAFHVRDGFPGGGLLGHFPLDLHTFSDQARVVPAQKFPIPPSTSIEIIKLGTEGYRAVWLEHNWESQQFRLMKLSAAIGDDYPNVGVVLPPDPELPFSPRECHSLAFDEVTGRICLGLFNGDLYVMDFV